MSLRDEQYRSIRRGRELIVKLMLPKETPRVPGWIRKEARQVIKHFPFGDPKTDRPHFSEDPFGPDLPPRKTERDMLELKAAVEEFLEACENPQAPTFDLGRMKRAVERANEK
jgi:hypothetical protein